MTCPPKRRRCEGRTAGGGIALIACAMLAASCGRGTDATPALTAQPATAMPAAQAGAAIPHGDHNPRYGGLVMMNGELHFEVVLNRDGMCHVYFSDATRGELPAATASALVVTVTRKGKDPETVAMRIDDSGESWVGRGHAVDEADATARVAYTAYGKPYFIDVPFPREK
jgi:hypothetical protein